MFEATGNKQNAYELYSKNRKPYSGEKYSSQAYNLKRDESIGNRCYIDIFAENPIAAIDLIFINVLPHFGYAVRNEQIKLSKKMFTGLIKKKVAICEAEVGTGKSLAYLVAALCAKRYEESVYNYSSPVTITTSNIELQTALAEQEIPNLSRMLIWYHIIDQPLTVVLRKGKEHYFCLLRYYDYINKISEHPDKFKEQLEYFESTAFEKKAFDLDKLKITSYIKSKICIRGRCYACVYTDECKYINFVRSVMSDRNPIDFQVTNHNLYLNSTRQEYILRYSPYVIIDEAHKLKEVAENIYGNSISENDIPKYLNWIKVFCDRKTSPQKFEEHCKTAERYNNLLFTHIHNLMKDGIKNNMITGYKEDINTELRRPTPSEEFIISRIFDIASKQYEENNSKEMIAAHIAKKRISLMNPQENFNCVYFTDLVSYITIDDMGIVKLHTKTNTLISEGDANNDCDQNT